ncbi:His Kinase A (phospho-acceptor) domain-containing protein [Dethiosulfatibacter aminovorans DSM 17477]|uniref:histidine kinase n=1 Tax=Dethiosulfatibacter aminovorans DSM 17477 TaxID=1121476 RepID=A0A1M6KH78_9FIRM|nr:HAMP domain-containing sensor histidine kinase [Dethiosulfatibacter aminovorans]SHJ58295.1 His Kinase A (phospho-acceptor) domain-containing protein [Dethiosulfatibacter aminovorans DSM 17477]
MFRKLRIRFTLSTLLILVVFLSILSTAVYLGTKKLITSSSEGMLAGTADRIIRTEDDRNNNGNDLIIPDLFENKKVMDKFENLFAVNDPKLKVGYVMYDNMLDVVYIRNSADIPYDEFEKYVLDSFQDRNSLFSLEIIDDVEYRIYTKFFNTGTKAGVVQLYQDVSMETFILEHLKHSLLFLIIVSSFILAVISWHLAGKSIRPVMESWKRQKEFIADASHELRTPLTVIQTNLDAAMCDNSGTIAENRVWLDNAYSETEVMSKLVGELLMLAKIDSNQVTIGNGNVDLTDLCRRTVDKFAENFKMKDISVEMNLEEGIMISGDELKLTQMLSILTDNAIKYSESPGKYSIRLNSEKNKAILKISDEGVGISDEDLHRIFDRFYRADKARHREEGGTGLGLSIAKWIVENHGGKIKVDSTVDIGTTFTVELPIND